MLIQRNSKMGSQQFVENYLDKNQPVIVTDAMKSWPALGKWTPAFMKSKLGELEVQVYDELFSLVDITTLSSYVEKNFDQGNGQPMTQYMRWYSQLKDIDFIWADEAFKRLDGDWSTPYFLPKSGYAVPYAPTPHELHAESSLFPYRGLFISGKGSRTRLHRDPWTTSALLCQFYGSKKLTIFAPDQASYLMNGAEFVDIHKPDLSRFPSFGQAQPIYEDVLNPGEILFIPSGWLHDVVSLTDSISITWNFVHELRARHLCDYLRAHPDDPEMDVLRFFLPQEMRANAQVDDIIRLLNCKSIL